MGNSTGICISGFLRPKRAGLESVPAVIEELSDREAVEVSIIENAQREDLNPIEEALAYRHLVEQFKLNHGEVAQVVGKNRSTISNSLRLFQLDERVQKCLQDGELSAGHGRALLMLSDPSEQWRFARRAIRNSLSVHALEKLVSRYLEDEEEAELSDEELKELASVKRQQTRVQNLLELEQVSLSFDSQGRRRLTLVFETEASWRRFISRIRE